MVVAAMKGADQHTRSSLGLSMLPMDTSTRRPGEMNQRPYNNKTLALPAAHILMLCNSELAQTVVSA